MLVFICVHLRYLRFISVSRDALGEVAVRGVNLQIIAGGDGESVGEHDDVETTGMFGRGMLAAGNSTRIIGQPGQQLHGAWDDATQVPVTSWAVVPSAARVAGSVRSSRLFAIPSTVMTPHGTERTGTEAPGSRIKAETSPPATTK